MKLALRAGNGRRGRGAALLAPILAAVLLLPGCAAVTIAGAATGAAISVAGAVVSTGVTLTGKAIGKTIDAVTPGEN